MHNTTNTDLAANVRQQDAVTSNAHIPNYTYSKQKLAPRTMQSEQPLLSNLQQTQVTKNAHTPNCSPILRQTSLCHAGRFTYSKKKTYTP